jgi:hypothetical protein
LTPACNDGSVSDEQAGDIRLQPALDQVGQHCLDHGGVLRRTQGKCQDVFVAGPVDADGRIALHTLYSVNALQRLIDPAAKARTALLWNTCRGTFVIFKSRNRAWENVHELF